MNTISDNIHNDTANYLRLLTIVGDNLVLVNEYIETLNTMEKKHLEFTDHLNIII